MTVPGRAPRGGAADPAQLVNRAVAALRDPETRRRIIEQGQDLADAIRRIQEERSRRGAALPGSGMASRLRAQVERGIGAGRLEHRASVLAGAIQQLGNGEPALAEALSPVRQAVEEIRVRIPAADALRGRPRRKLLSALDDRLDELESSFAEMLLPAAPDEG